MDKDNRVITPIKEININKLKTLEIIDKEEFSKSLIMRIVEEIANENEKILELELSNFKEIIELTLEERDKELIVELEELFSIDDYCDFILEEVSEQVKALIITQQGPQGERGEQGPQGEQGLLGETGSPGEKGDEGRTPMAIWKGTSVGFTDKTGVARKFVELKGETGNIPEHEWLGFHLRFKNPDGTWGKLVNLLGSSGIPGTPGGFVPAGGNNGPGGFVAQNGYVITGGRGPKGQSIYVGDFPPDAPDDKYLWIQTGLGDDGDCMTFWVETGK